MSESSEQSTHQETVQFADGEMSVDDAEAMLARKCHERDEVRDAAACDEDCQISLGHFNKEISSLQSAIDQAHRHQDA